MKEMTSAYDDVEKRMAIFLGITALLFCSLYLFTQGADLFTFLIRGVLALTVFTIAGWAYGRWLRSLIARHSEDEELPDNTERQSRDAKKVESRVIMSSELGESVIPAEGESPRTPGQAIDFTMPEFEPIDLGVPPAPAQATAAVAPIPMAPMIPASVPRAPLPVNLVDDEGDLPPPPVPVGAR